MLKDQITADMKGAMKAGDAKKLGVLRMLISALNNKKLEKRAKSGKDEDLTDEEALESVAREVKKRKESIAAFTTGGRVDLAENEQSELVILTPYLPAQMSEAEVIAAVDRLIAAAAQKDFGAVMKDVMKELKGKADAAFVSKLVKEKLL